MAEHNGKDLKALAFIVSEILNCNFWKTCFILQSGFLSFLELQKSLLVCFQGCWTQWDRFQSSTIHHFWDTPQHFLKTYFCWESGFLSFLELQKSLLVCFQGCWTQWQRFESSSIHHFWDTPQHFLKTHFCLESGFLSFLELQKSLSKWLLNTMGQVSKPYHSPFLRYPTAVSQNTFLLRKWLSFIPRAPEIPTSKFSGLLNTMGQVSKLYHSPFLRYPTAFSQNTFLLRKWLSVHS